MVMASVGVFESKLSGMKIFGTTAALTAFALAIAGGVLLLRRGHWWVVGPALYFTFIWLQWGTRIKPRYMVPIAPLLFLFVWSGLTWLIVLLAAQPKGSNWNGRYVGRAVLASLVGIVVLGNLFPWGVEFYVRHLSGREFYDVARRSAYAQLVDIGAYAQRNVPAGESLWMTAGAHRRIAYFLSGHKIETNDLVIRNWNDWQVLAEQNRQDQATTNPAASQPLVKKRRMTYAQRRRRFFAAIPKQAKYLIVYVDHPRKEDNWPGWHLPMRADDPSAEWWRLYERQPNESWRVVSLPHSRDYVRNIPPAVE
jgi:hypothetical protein